MPQYPVGLSDLSDLRARVATLEEKATLLEMALSQLVKLVDKKHETPGTEPDTGYERGPWLR